MDQDASQTKDLKLKALRKCQEFLPGAWQELKINELIFTPISGGLSNALFCCTLPDHLPPIKDEPSQVLLRFYGNQICDGNISTQLRIFKILSRKNLGPKLFGDFEEGRIEEFLPASSLTLKDLRDSQVSTIIAKRLATIHNLDVPVLQKHNFWLIEKFNEYLDFANDNAKQLANLELRSSTRKLAKKVLSIKFDEEIQFLRKLFDNSNSPLVFSHNDLHQGNILLTEICKNRTELSDRIVFIDFEFSSYNYRAYDIANHFCEFCFDYNYPYYPFFSASLERFPSEADQRVFLLNYLDQLRHSDAAQSASMSNGTKHDTIANGMSKINKFSASDDNNNSSEVFEDEQPQISTRLSHSLNHGDKLARQQQQPPITDSCGQEEEDIMREIKPFIMASHLFWTLWSIKNAFCSPIQFGFWEFAMCRWKLYYDFKKNYVDELRMMAQDDRSLGLIDQ